MTQNFSGDRRLARSHLARAYELDKTLRPRRETSPMALDAAAARRQPTHSRPTMSFDSNQLFQRGPGDAGYREPRRYRTHALDEGGHGGAREHIEHARNHVGAVLSGHSELDAKRLGKYLAAALAARDSEPDDVREPLQRARKHVDAVMSGDTDFDADRLRKYLADALEALGEEEAEDFDTEADRTAEERMTAEERHRRATGEGEDGEEEREAMGATPAVSAVATRDSSSRRRRARDAMGEVPPRSSVSTRGLRGRVDHRRDFDDRSQGGAESGADSVHGHDSSAYDPAALFQRSAAR